MSTGSIFLLAIGLVLIFEGLAYGLHPGGMKRLMMLALDQPDSQLRNMGLILALIGAGLIYLVM